MAIYIDASTIHVWFFNNLGHDSNTLIKHLASLYMDISPYDIQVIRNKEGKPEIFGFNFNLSNKKNLTAISISKDPVGIDIEYEDTVTFDDKSLWEMTMSQREMLAICNEPNEKMRHRSFLNLWTKKEALLKNLKVGIRGDLTQIDTLSYSLWQFLPIIFPIGVVDDTKKWIGHVAHHGLLEKKLVFIAHGVLNDFSWT